MELSAVRTGDVLLFSGNSPTGFLLKTFVSSQWNHVGIAVRFVGQTISLTTAGELYVYETNTGARYDHVLGQDIVGAAFSPAEFVFGKYNKIVCRPLHDSLRTADLPELILTFAQRTQGNKFPSSALPFLGVWLGVPLQSEEDKGSDMFCSELTAYFYHYCVGFLTHQRSGRNLSLGDLFGPEAPTDYAMYTPGHFSSQRTPNACIFSGPELVVTTIYADLLYVTIQPLILVLFIMMWIALALAQDREESKPLRNG